jgi:hypothetical protein
MKTTDEIMEMWRAITRDVEETAAKCQADPAEAALLGITQDVENSGGDVMFGRQRGPRGPVNERAGWLRGTARARISDDWQWQVQEMIGGGAALVLLAYEPQERRPREYPP